MAVTGVAPVTGAVTPGMAAILMVVGPATTTAPSVDEARGIASPPGPIISGLRMASGTV